MGGKQVRKWPPRDMVIVCTCVIVYVCMCVAVGVGGLLRCHSASSSSRMTSAAVTFYVGIQEAGLSERHIISSTRVAATVLSIHANNNASKRRPV